MPQLQNPAIDLLLDIDFDSKRIDKKHYDNLIKTVEKSRITKSSTQTVLSRKVELKNRKLPSGIEKLKTSDPEIKPQFEIERTESFPVRPEKNSIFDLNKKFVIADQILGPFPVIGGPDIIFNLYKYYDDFKVFFSGESQAAFIIPVKISRIVLPGGGPRDTLTLIKGSVWIRADLLDPAAPKESYTGFRINSGSLKFSSEIEIHNDTVTVPKSTRFELNLKLDNSYGSGLNSAIGPDGTKTKFAPPDELKLKTQVTRRLSRLTPDGTHIFKSATMGRESEYSTATNPVFKWDNDSKNILLGLKPLVKSATAFQVRKSESDLYDLTGIAKISDAAWVLGSRELPGNLSIEVAFNGQLQLGLEEGLQLQWDGIRNPETFVKVNNCKLFLLNGIFGLVAQNSDFGLLHEQMKLWQKSEESDHFKAEFNFSNSKELLIASVSDTSDIVFCHTDAELDIDKPICADNRPVRPRFKNCSYGKVHDKDGKQIILTGVNPDYINSEDYQFALQNAYFTTTKEIYLGMAASYDASNIAQKGEINCWYGIYLMFPTLPHPYATNRLNQRMIRPKTPQGVFKSVTNWSKSGDLITAEVNFSMNQVLTNQSEEIDIKSARTEARLVNPKQFNFVLFDVSTESDHWGIGFSGIFRRLKKGNIREREELIDETEEGVVTINRNYIQTPHDFLIGMTLPQVSWEPVYNISPPDPPGNPDPKEGLLNQVNNAMPTIFYQNDGSQTKIHPKDYISKFKNNLRDENDKGNENLQTKVLFTLPNGICSVVSLFPYKPDEKYYNNDHLNFIEPGFKQSGEDLKGGIQFRIAATDDNPEGAEPMNPPRLRGASIQFPTLKDWPGISMLGQSVTTIFNGVFYDENNSDWGQVEVGVPVTHLDFSGYGASTFSDWRNPLVKFASISQAKFDIAKGRTANELVQAVSVIYPWGIGVTRTVTFNRNNNSVLYREDSGWVAQSEGLFDFSFKWSDDFNNLKTFDSPFEIYPGITEGLFNIRNIKEDYNDLIDGISYIPVTGDYYWDKQTNKIYKIGDGPHPLIPELKVIFVAVYFDADVKFDNMDNMVAGRRFKGYLQLSPNGVPIPDRILKKVMEENKQPILGHTDVVMPVEDTLQQFRANAVEMTASYKEDKINSLIFVGSVKGSFLFPKEGSWSVVEVDQDSGDVSNLEPGVSPGLIKDGMIPKNGDPRPMNNPVSLLAFPDGLKNTMLTFSKTYGIIQNTDTQKLMMKAVEFTKGKVDEFVSDTALLADSFRLLNSKGPFPNLKDAIELIEGDPAKTVMNLLPEGIKKTFNYTVPNNFSFDIVGNEGDDFRIYIKYTTVDNDGNPVTNEKTVIDYVTDPVASVKNWANDMHNITIAVDLGVFKPILYVSGNFQGGENAKASLEGGAAPQLKLDKALQKIYDILQFLAKLDPKTAASAAISEGLKIAMSNSADSWEYKFKADKEISLVRFPFLDEAYNSPVCPLKMDAFFKIGVFFNQPLKIPESIDQLKPSVGAYLELGATLKVMCVSVAAATIYANGSAEVRLSADLVSGPKLHFKFGFGAELAVGFPVIGNASVTFMTGIDMELTMKDFTVGAFLYFKGRVEIFGGVATITIAIEAKGQVQKRIGNGPANCTASVTLAVDISIAWIINISFTETWSETRQIS